MTSRGTSEVTGQWPSWVTSDPSWPHTRWPLTLRGGGGTELGRDPAMGKTDTYMTSSWNNKSTGNQQINTLSLKQNGCHFDNKWDVIIHPCPRASKSLRPCVLRGGGWGCYIVVHCGLSEGEVGVAISFPMTHDSEKFSKNTDTIL